YGTQSNAITPPSERSGPRPEPLFPIRSGRVNGQGPERHAVQGRLVHARVCAGPMQLTAVRATKERSMHRYMIHTLTTFGLLVVLACLPASGQTTRFSAAGAWTFDVEPYLWLPALDGDLTVRGRTAQVDVSIGEFVENIFESLQFAAIGRMEARRGPLVFTLD